MSHADVRLDVLFVAACPFPCSRGTPIRAFRLAEAMHRRGHDVRVVTYHFGESEPRPSFPVVRTPSLSFYRDLSPGPTLVKLLALDPLLALTVRRELARRPPDVVHAHHYEGYLTSLAARRNGPPVVFDVHTLLESELPAYGTWVPAIVKRALGAWIDSVVASRTSQFVAVSERMKQKLHENHEVPHHGITVIPSGVEDHMFQLPVKAPWPGASEDQVIVYAGSLAPFQNVEGLLEVFARVSDRVPGVRLLIVSGDDFEPLEALARQLGVREAVILEQTDFASLPRYLAAGDVALNPRAGCDGVPQKILNYMAAGCPIVTFSGYGGYLEHGRSALIVPQGDLDAMSRAVVHLLQNRELARQLGDQARRRAKSEFAWSSAARKLEELHLELAQTRQGHTRSAPVNPATAETA